MRGRERRCCLLSFFLVARNLLNFLLILSRRKKNKIYNKKTPRRELWGRAGTETHFVCSVCMWERAIRHGLDIFTCRHRLDEFLVATHTCAEEGVGGRFICKVYFRFFFFESRQCAFRYDTQKAGRERRGAGKRGLPPACKGSGKSASVCISVRPARAH